MQVDTPSELTFLHLADLQFEPGELGPHKVSLLEDILDQAKRGLRPEFVFVTGDIARSGQAGEYEAATIFFRQLMEMLGLGPERFYFVPGNHDVNLDISQQQSMTKQAYADSRGGLLLAYNQFVENLLGRSSGFEDDSLFYAQNLTWGDLPIAIVGINSSDLLDPFSSALRDSLLISYSSIFLDAINVTQHARLRILLMHHGMDELSRTGSPDVLRLLQAQANFILHAHTRSETMFVQPPVSNNAAVVINSGSIYLAEHYPSVYLLVRFDIDQRSGSVRQRTLEERLTLWGGSMPVVFQGTLLPALDIVTLKIHEDVSTANVRKMPNLDAAIVDDAAGGTLLEALDDNALSKVGDESAWIQVRMLNGDEGYIQGSLVRSNYVKGDDLPPSVEQKSAETPSTEPVTATPAGIRMSRYDNDSALSGADDLGIKGEVETFARVFAARQVEPPLCMGLFGDWGSGKSFFMNQMRQTISKIAEQSGKAKKADQPSDFHANIVQVEFNAWHYVDSNLWASLSSHIFKSLDKYLEAQAQEKQREEMYKQLDAAAEARARADRAYGAAKITRINAETKLDEIRGKAISNQQALDAMTQALWDSPAVKNARDAMVAAAQEMGMPKMAETMQDGRVALGEMRSLGGRINAAFLWLASGRGRERWQRIGMLLFLIVIVPLVPIALGYILKLVSSSQIELDELTSLLTQLTTFVAGLITWVSGVLKKVSEGLGELEKKQAQVDDAIQKASAQPSAEMQKIQKELADLEKQEDAARQALLEAQRREADAQAAIDRAGAMTDARSLAEFIHAEAANQAIQDQLGLISIIRQNFEKLAELLEKGQKDPSLPRVDRIILYIDDLDRCPEEKVVQVLQAVHLLMAFKLFIVVVGVDSRWLLHSLEKAYPALQISNGQRFGWVEDEGWAWESTPQNYLEKIFQIPYHLRPMDKAGFKSLMSSLMPDTATGQVANMSFSLPGDTQNQPPSNLPPAQEEISLPQSDHAEVQLLDTVSAPGTERQSPVEDSLPLMADFLSVGDVEKAFIPHLSRLIHTPRAAKRFVNIYRILRASQTPAELERFLGAPDDPVSRQFPAVMLLLAILTGSPHQAPHFFRKLLSLEKTHPWKDAVSLLKPRQVIGEGTPFGNGLLPRFSAADAVEWKRLHATLNEILGNEALNLPEKVGDYQGWISRVARFSFRVGKIGENIDLNARIAITTVGVEPSAAAPGEFVEIHNDGDCAQSLTGWMLSDAKHHTFTFPQFELGAGCVVRIWTGVGADSSTDLYWGRKAAIWNDNGDRAILRDYAGSLVAAFDAIRKK